MQRHDMIDAMRGLRLKGMAGAFDEAVTTGLQRQRTTMEILTDLLRAEATHRHAASIRYRMPVWDQAQLTGLVSHGRRCPAWQGEARSLPVGESPAQIGNLVRRPGRIPRDGAPRLFRYDEAMSFAHARRGSARMKESWCVPGGFYCGAE